MKRGNYSTELSKGQGAFREIQALLRIWDPKTPIEELRKKAIREGTLGNSSATRTSDLVVRVFARRLLSDNGRPARLLKGLLERNVSIDVYRQINLVFTARQHPILSDFLKEVYWPAYSAGKSELTRQDAEAFLHNAFEQGRITSPWSPGMVVRTASYLLSTASEFGMLDESRTSIRRILPYRFLDATGLFLAWENHERGFSDTGLLSLEDWKLFAMGTQDIIRCLERLTSQHQLIAQYSGELLSIAWTFSDEEAFLDGLARIQV